MMKAWQHFKTITTHKIWVMRYTAIGPWSENTVFG